jgi:hypothetical protein
LSKIKLEFNIKLSLKILQLPNPEECTMGIIDLSNQKLELRNNRRVQIGGLHQSPPS